MAQNQLLYPTFVIIENFFPMWTNNDITRSFHTYLFLLSIPERCILEVLLRRGLYCGHSTQYSHLVVTNNITVSCLVRELSSNPSALPGKMGKHEDHTFHSNAVLVESAAAIGLCCTHSTAPARCLPDSWKNKNSSGDEIANVSFFYETSYM